jgi:hypothetical protein
MTTELVRTPRPVGRPSRLPVVRALYFEAVNEGANRAEAIYYAGIGTSTFYRWMADPRPEYREFRAAVEMAEAARKRAQIDASLRVRATWHLLRASKRSVWAALRWLEANDPEKWAPRSRRSRRSRVR